VAAPGIVVTNAHVVAGESDTAVEVGGESPELRATVVRFAPRYVVAVLRVAGLALPALRLASQPVAQTPGAILGYPLDGPFVAEPARIGVTQDLETRDVYGRGPLARRLTPVRGLIRPGNSGGPVVATSGSVLTTVFAATTGGGPHGGFGVANAIVRNDLTALGGAVSTEGCTG
jgi:S1-C subfamily serine protease